MIYYNKNNIEKEKKYLLESYLLYLFSYKLIIDRINSNCKKAYNIY